MPTNAKYSSRVVDGSLVALTNLALNRPSAQYSVPAESIPGNGISSVRYHSQLLAYFRHVVTNPIDYTAAGNAKSTGPCDQTMYQKLYHTDVRVWSLAQDLPVLAFSYHWNARAATPSWVSCPSLQAADLALSSKLLAFVSHENRIVFTKIDASSVGSVKHTHFCNQNNINYEHYAHTQTASPLAQTAGYPNILAQSHNAPLLESIDFEPVLKHHNVTHTVSVKAICWKEHICVITQGYSLSQIQLAHTTLLMLIKVPSAFQSSPVILFHGLLNKPLPIHTFSSEGILRQLANGHWIVLFEYLDRRKRTHFNLVAVHGSKTTVVHLPPYSPTHFCIIHLTRHHQDTLEFKLALLKPSPTTAASLRTLARSFAEPLRCVIAADTSTISAVAARLNSPWALPIALVHILLFVALAPLLLLRTETKVLKVKWVQKEFWDVELEEVGPVFKSGFKVGSMFRNGREKQSSTPGSQFFDYSPGVSFTTSRGAGVMRKRSGNGDPTDDSLLSALEHGDADSYTFSNNSEPTFPYKEKPYVSNGFTKNISTIWAGIVKWTIPKKQQQSDQKSCGQYKEKLPSHQTVSVSDYETLDVKLITTKSWPSLSFSGFGRGGLKKRCAGVNSKTSKLVNYSQTSKPVNYAQTNTQPTPDYNDDGSALFGLTDSYMRIITAGSRYFGVIDPPAQDLSSLHLLKFTPTTHSLTTYARPQLLRHFSLLCSLVCLALLTASVVALYRLVPAARLDLLAQLALADAASVFMLAWCQDVVRMGVRIKWRWWLRG